jgi:CheY-like chemotaxis protein
MPHTVMVVDDNPDEIVIMKRVLLKTGLVKKIKTAPRGETALALLREKAADPALIFLDLKMPGMNGIDTVRQIRADACMRHIPVVIVTNSSLETDKKAAYDAGADGFLHKAFDMEQFQEDIKSFLERWMKM